MRNRPCSDDMSCYHSVEQTRLLKTHVRLCLPAKPGSDPQNVGMSRVRQLRPNNNHGPLANSAYAWPAGSSQPSAEKCLDDAVLCVCRPPLKRHTVLKELPAPPIEHGTWAPRSATAALTVVGRHPTNSKSR